MKVLKDLISNLTTKTIAGNLDAEIVGLTLDSREVKPGYVFAAIKGSQTDGHQFIDKAIALGASAILCEDEIKTKSDIAIVRVEHAAEALGQLADAFYDRPSTKLKLVGITGTNGKTSIATLLYESYLMLGYKAGLLSTIKYSVNGKDFVSTHTTPHSVRINELMANMVDEGCEFVFMEVSSHALDQYRTAGLDFDGAVFTNITHDHLDYHKNFKDYLYTKKKLFDGLKSDAFALFNSDDKNGSVIVQNTKASKYSYSLKSMSDFKTKVVESDLEGMLLNIRGDEVWLKLVGNFNAYNVLAVYAVCFLLGEEHFDIITTLSKLGSVNGRFQHVQYSGVTGIIDYAHTPDALQNVLDTINAIRTKNEELICVIGCGGNRDKEKRPVMARIACQHSTKVILTSDNPRNEDPEEILNDMMEGVEPIHYKKILRITNREEAIKTAVSIAHKGDVILVAGKGHETYQEIEGVRHPFDDKEVINRNLKLIHS